MSFGVRRKASKRKKMGREERALSGRKKRRKEARRKPAKMPIAVLRP